jgi:Glucosidase II beta subunit-like protein
MTMVMRMRRRDSKIMLVPLLLTGLMVFPIAWNPYCLADSSYNYYDPFELSGGGGTTEYDAMVIDPLGAIYSHGAPYGGYGRASRAALARLPLILPEISSSSSSSSSVSMEDDNEEDLEEELHHYFRVRDHGGQLFACRLYHEDALDRSSLHDSMFTPPVLQPPRTTTTTAAAQRQTIAAAAADLVAKTTTATTANTNNIAKPQQTITATAATTPASSVVTVDQPKTAKASLPTTTRVIRPSSSSIGGSAGGSSSSPAAVTGSSPAAAATTPAASTSVANDGGDGDNNDDSNIDPVEVELTLRESLHGVCGQVHKGYWSYEWCFEREVTQFHVEYDTTTNQVKVDQVTNLGMYAHREMYFLDQQSDENEHTMVNEWAEDEPEVARIVDAHLDGTLCGGTDVTTPTPRRTYALLQCCSDKIVKRHKGMIHREGRPYQTDLIAVLDVVEDPDIQCLYNVTVCTPLLCGSSSTTAAAATADTANAALAAAQAAVAATRLLEDLNGINKINHEESIRQILDRTLNQLCLQSQSGGWWVYEICHQKSIRQYHETLGVRKNSAGAKVSAKVVESEHILGRYDITNESHVPDEEEWKLVVNATTTSSTAVAASLLWGEGNGAYYQVEYTGGDTCDTADVTDSAVVAGTKTAGSSSNKAVFLLQRAASVRYHCGHTFDVQVSEDTTCHYIVDVKVPGLCRHPLFRAPIAKKQVMKCLPVPDDE